MENIYVDLRTIEEEVSRHFPNKDIVSIDEILGLIVDLTDDVEHYKQELEDTIQDREDNYRPIPIAEQVGISNSDFI